MATKPNASTAKTRRRLHDACLRLAEDHDLRTLTVNQIVGEAGLNRTTFYLHYPDAASLVVACVEELFDRMWEGGRALLTWDPASPDVWEETFFTTIAERPRLFARMLAGTREDALVRRFLDNSETGIRDIWQHHGLLEGADPAYVSMLASFAASGMLGMTVEWLKTDPPVDTQQICRWAWELALTVGRMPMPLEVRMTPAEANPGIVTR